MWRQRILQPFLNNPYSMEVVLVIFKITAATSFPKKEVAAAILKIANTTSNLGLIKSLDSLVTDSILKSVHFLL